MLNRTNSNYITKNKRVIPHMDEPIYEVSHGYSVCYPVCYIPRVPRVPRIRSARDVVYGKGYRCVQYVACGQYGHGGIPCACGWQCERLSIARTPGKLQVLQGVVKGFIVNMCQLCFHHERVYAPSGPNGCASRAPFTASLCGKPALFEPLCYIASAAAVRSGRPV